MIKAINGALAAIALGLVWTHPASAGRKDFAPVTILVWGGTGAASGSLGSARNDLLDPTEYIGCESTIDSAGLDYWSGSCSARRFGVSVTCTFPIFAQSQYQDMVTNITPDSLISFSWDTATNVCNSLYVYTNSYDEPKLP